jgi:quinol monooxygenase YgiN
MYIRFLQLKINPDYLEMLQPFYDQIVIPELQKIPGCLFAGLIQSGEINNECISLTFWETKEQAENFENSDTFQRMINKIKPYLSESTEWKIQLSQDFQLEYEPVKEEPVLRKYRVMSQTKYSPSWEEAHSQLHVRLVSLKLQEGKLEEFRKIYMDEIVPVLQSTKGCRYIYLTESLHEENEVISLTIWNSKEDADHYENSGQFAELVKKVRHTFSQFYQWKMALEKDIKGRVKTSEDMEIDHYGLVSGKRFD